MEKQVDASKTSVRRAPMEVARRVVKIARTAVVAWVDDRCPSMAASVAFFAAFSLAPMLVIIIAVAGFFFGVEAVEGRLYGSIKGLVGSDGALAIQSMVSNAWKSGASGWTTAISLMAIAVGATATFAELNAALNGIWKVDPKTAAKRSGGIMGLLRVRMISFGVVIGVGFLIMVSLVFDAALAWANEFLWRSQDPEFIVARVAQALSAFVLLSAAFAILLKMLPDRQLSWSSVVFGAITAAALFSGGKQLFSMYLAQAGTANSFGAAGSLAVVLMWLFYSAAVFLLGAEISAAGVGERDPAPDHPRPAAR